MQIPDKAVESATELDRSSFERLREKWFRPPYDQYGLNLLRQMKTNELVLTQYYCGRAPYELLQNADDVCASEAVFVLLPEGLVFAHNGDWFSARNFKSLADGWSDKDPNQCIGHKGLGFRSVLEITPSPHLARLSPGVFFAVRFSQTLNQAHIDETLQRHPDLGAEVQEWTKNKQSICPIMYISTLVERHQLGACAAIYEALRQDKYGPAFTTMFWFPVDDPSGTRIKNNPASAPIRAGGAGQTSLMGWVTGEVPVLLPFLRSIRRVAVYQGDTCLAETTTQETGQEAGLSEVAIEIRTPGQIQQRRFLLLRDNVRIPLEFKNKQEMPVALRQMDTARIVLALRLDGKRPALTDRSKFHVYFPTEEASGFPFTVHADFQVKPDRTALVPGSYYNRWLLKQIASRATGEFLTQLLTRFGAADALEALAPTDDPLAVSTKEFVQAVISALRDRHAPFVPTRLGLLSPDVVLMPPDVDSQGFWEKHFSGVIDKQYPGRQAFLDPAADRPRVRKLLREVGVEHLHETAVLDLMEQSVASPQPAAWWHRCYAYLANSRELSHLPHASFVGRRLIPLADGTIASVTGDQGRIVCLPPSFDDTQLTVPRLFDEVFIWMAPELATLLGRGDTGLRTWLLDRLALARFEATDLLPRAIRSVVPRIFDGKQEVTLLSVRRAWLFIKRIVDASKVSIGSAVFWQEIGRFPVPLVTTTFRHEIANMRPEHLVPAFLSYFPDGFGESDALRGVDSLARVDKGFLGKLVAESKQPQDEWIGFFRQAGISSGPKMLKYGRIVGRSDEVLLTSEGLASPRSSRHSGERQIDENQAVLDVLRDDGLWTEIVSDARACTHAAPKALHALNAIHGLRQVVELAEKESLAGDENWKARLWSLTREIDSGREPRDPDQIYCRGGVAGGHAVQIGKYIERQLDRFRWLPSSLGPASSSQCFFRRPGYSLISSGRTGDNFGDLVLPYVVAENVETVAHLQQLGVEELGSAAAAKSSTLIRALRILAERVSVDGQEMLYDRGRWRLVRGAIQETYRILNQRNDGATFPADLKLATRGVESVVFRSRPIHFADPGSPVEQAFRGTLALLDADRPYPELFRRLSVVRLVAGDTVVEEFAEDVGSESAEGIYADIVKWLAPYLLASVLAKSERADQRDVILRRLRERFAVKAANKLTVSYWLKGTQTEKQSIEFPKFYLQRRIERRPGLIQEANFILYVRGKPAPSSIFDAAIDSDALGAALVPLFLDDPSEEVSSLFPRITSRFCYLRGNPTDMEEFMYRQLGVSREALENAEVLVSGGEDTHRPLSEPPVVIVSPPKTSNQEAEQEIKQMLTGHHAALTDAASNVVASLTGTSAGPGRGTGRAHAGQITPEQEERGRSGEEEIKRRLSRTEGWEGFHLVKDTRAEGCGYDFLCSMAEREVALEVKTFKPDGAVYITETELKVAFEKGPEYYLCGVIADDGPAAGWQTVLLSDPFGLLLRHGKFEIDARLQVRAAELFGVLAGILT